ncbi:MAG: hypothetical protein ACE37F_11880 [Nannocystaceae bacterium]|nr:carboxypeptidase-like regulatory domain-containing protein [bacterium]
MPVHRTTVFATTLAALLGCSPIVREAEFVGARDQVTDVSLEGPFDGQIVDATTSEPIQGASVVGVWSYDQGDGLLGPAGSESVLVKTDQAGRYRIPEAPLKVRGPGVRLVAFELVAYKRGYVAYRSDAVMAGGARTDFTLRQNRIELDKWRESDSHADHLLFLAAPPVIQQLTKWERDQANLDLYRALGGAGAGAGPTAPGDGEPTSEETPTLELLDARGLLPPDEVRRRTGYADAFDVKDLADLARTHFYHGVHLQAVDRDETFDIAYRVWKSPPGGLDSVQETFEATLPGVEQSSEITDQTWVFDSDDVRAVAFLDPEASVGLLLTCGVQQCVDIETAIILAKFAADHLDQITTEAAPESVTAPGPSSGGMLR